MATMHEAFAAIDAHPVPQPPRGLVPNFHGYDWMLISSSAGKDSLVMLDYVMEIAKEQQYPSSQIVVVHADLGRMEWPGVKEWKEGNWSHAGGAVFYTKSVQLSNFRKECRVIFDLVKWEKHLSAGVQVIYGN